MASRKARKARARQPRPPRPEAAAPPWLVALRQCLWTDDFPQVDPRFQAMNGETFLCQRSVEEQGQRLVYREVWRDSLSLEPVHSWVQELDHASNGGDIIKAAIMLNDKLETVIANYAHLRDQNVAEEVYDVLDRRNGQGK